MAWELALPMRPAGFRFCVCLWCVCVCVRARARASACVWVCECECGCGCRSVHIIFIHILYVYENRTYTYDTPTCDWQGPHTEFYHALSAVRRNRTTSRAPGFGTAPAPKENFSRGPHGLCTQMHTLRTDVRKQINTHTRTRAAEQTQTSTHTHIPVASTHTHIPVAGPGRVCL